MERKKASDFPQELLDLFDEYVHGGMSRRDFLDRAQKFAVGGVTATALFEMLRPNYALAIQVPAGRQADQSGTRNGPVTKGNGSIKGYLVRPANATGKLPGDRGHPREPRPQSVYRRCGATAGGCRLHGVRARWPDLGRRLSGRRREGRAALFTQVDNAKMRDDLLAAAKWLKARPDSTGKLGAVGFCFGGSIVNQLAVRMGSDLDAAVPFYGGQPSADDTAKIKAPISAQYGGLDTRITSGWPAFDNELTAAHVPHEGYRL